MERRIVMAVEKAAEMSIDEIIHGGRNREIVVARQVAMYMIHRPHLASNWRNVQRQTQPSLIRSSR